MSTLVLHTEQKALQVLIKCLPYFDELKNLELTAEDAFYTRHAENTLRGIIERHEYRKAKMLALSSVPAANYEMYVLVMWPEEI